LIVFENRNSSRLSDSAVCISSARAAVPERRPRVLRSIAYLRLALGISCIALPACAEADNDAPAICARHLKQRQWSSLWPPINVISLRENFLRRGSASTTAALSNSRALACPSWRSWRERSRMGRDCWPQSLITIPFTGAGSGEEMELGEAVVLE
jgi:hypothetical protein